MFEIQNSIEPMIKEPSNFSNTSIHSKSSTQVRPTCIVIGCKNGMGYTSPNVKYYQVPDLENNNSIARQWYINTLREDLLENLLDIQLDLATMDSNIVYQKPHFVCIEHFDEESFMLPSSIEMGQQQISETQLIALKEDAVPSLFEIEVFQKMFAYQEQLALNQQQKKLKQQELQTSATKSINHSPTHKNNNLLSSVILNGDRCASALVASEPSLDSCIELNTSTNKSSNTSNMSNKRPRMDPDLREALIKRVPKALKRTALINLPIQLQKQPSSEHSTQSKEPQRAQKAVKHTMPRSLLPPQNTDSSTANSCYLSMALQNSNSNDVSTSISMGSDSLQINNLTSVSLNGNLTNFKTIKQNGSNSFLKGCLLPPPIMQSTKRTNGLNKAVKRTGGGTQTYYKSLIKGPQPSFTANTSTTAYKIQLQPTTTQILSYYNSLQNTSNKITSMPSYVYKRVNEPPEIDLLLECVEEEYICIEDEDDDVDDKNKIENDKISENEPLEKKICKESKIAQDLDKENRKENNLSVEVKSNEISPSKPSTPLIINISSSENREEANLSIKPIENKLNEATVENSNKKSDSFKQQETINCEEKSSSLLSILVDAKKNVEVEKSNTIIGDDVDLNERKIRQSAKSKMQSSIRLSKNELLQIENSKLPKYSNITNSSLNKTDFRRKTSNVTHKNRLRRALKSAANESLGYAADNDEKSDNSMSIVEKNENKNPIKRPGPGRPRKIKTNLIEPIETQSLKKKETPFGLVDETLANTYLPILSKYYSRRLGTFLKHTSNSNLNSSNNKRLRSQSYLPNDLKPGNYPAKCYVCGIILPNNIELTSHICSHLESSSNENAAVSGYISPFDAVTSTCGICEITFIQPFELIRHLDLVMNIFSLDFIFLNITY
jgi:hypothetical protein